MSSGACRLSQNNVLLLVAMTLVVTLLGGCQADEARVATFIERGDDYVENEQPEEAVIEFKNVLQIDPENAAAHEALSLAYLEVEKPREAYWEMSETVRLDPGNIVARLRYGSVSAIIGDYDVSMVQADAILELDPTNSAAHILRGQALENKKDLEGAEAEFLSALENDPEAAAYRFLLSAFFERQGRRADAEQALHDLVEVEESYVVIATLGEMISRAEGREDEAQKYLERAIELAREAPIEKPKGNPKATVRDLSLISNVTREEAVQRGYRALSGFHFGRGRFDQSVEVLEEGVKVSETKVELIYQLAMVYRAKGMSEEENAMIRRATEESPGSVPAQLVLSTYLGRSGDLDGALEAARAAVAIDAKSRPAQLRVAELLVDMGYRAKDEAVIQAGRAIVDSVLDDEPSNPEAFFVRAKIELAENDVEAAKTSLETVLQSRPDWAQARYVLGTVLAASNDLSRARVELARAVEVDPQLLPARKLLAKLHSQLGEHEFAIEQGRAYLAEEPDDSDVRIVVGQSLIRVGRTQEAYAEVERIPEDQRGAPAYFALGRLDLAFGRQEQGAERLKKADELEPGNAQVLRTLLALDVAQENLDGSVERVARALEAKPDDTEIAEIDAEIKMVLGDIEGARVAFERAVELESRNVTAQLALADLEAQAGNVDGKIAIMERAALAVPESSDLQYRLALVYDEVGRRAQAMDAYEKAISINQDLALAKNNLAYLLSETGGDLDRALELAQQAKEQLPDDGSAADTLGWVLLKRGVPSAAIGYLQEALERFPSGALAVHGEVRNHLAAAYEANNEAEKAISESQNSVEYYQSMAKASKEQGGAFEEPDWARDARDRIERLTGAS